MRESACVSAFLWPTGWDGKNRPKVTLSFCTSKKYTFGIRIWVAHGFCTQAHRHRRWVRS